MRGPLFASGLVTETECSREPMAGIAIPPSFPSTLGLTPAQSATPRFQHTATSSPATASSRNMDFVFQVSMGAVAGHGWQAGLASRAMQSTYQTKVVWGQKMSG